MTSGQSPAPFLDPANTMLAQVPARLETGMISRPGQPLTGVLTIRTASTTLSVMLTPEDARNWAQIISEFARSLGRPGLMAASMTDIARISQDGKPGQPGEAR